MTEFRKTSREILPELTGLMFNEPKMTSKISVECPASFYAFKDTVCSKHLPSNTNYRYPSSLPRAGDIGRSPPNFPENNDKR